MKKIMLSFVCCLLLLGGCGEKADLGGKVYDMDVEVLQKKLNDKDSFVLVVSRETCTHCQDLKKYLEKTITEHATIIYKYEMNESSMDALITDAQLMQSILEESDASKEYSTPHVYYIYEGKVRDSFEGFDETYPEQFWDFIKDNSLENAK